MSDRKIVKITAGLGVTMGGAMFFSILAQALGVSVWVGCICGALIGAVCFLSGEREGE